jgi:SpoVK/Ycf46/Vps4 family AAA+-type ATPase
MEPVDTKIDLDSIDLFYTEKTFSKVDKILKSIKKSNKGLSVLYGERGNGKTSIINYIASKLDRVVIFIPNNLIEQTINNPDFRKFIKKHHKPIIIIDDCEMLLNELFTKSNIFVNNLLQMVDGFLSDSMEVNIITIFNVDDESEIDHSLLECNNLIDVVKFEELSEEESNELSKHLGQDKKYKNKNKVIDIIKKRKSKSIKDIGF